MLASFWDPCLQLSHIAFCRASSACAHSRHARCSSVIESRQLALEAGQLKDLRAVLVLSVTEIEETYRGTELHRDPRVEPARLSVLVLVSSGSYIWSCSTIPRNCSILCKHTTLFRYCIGQCSNVCKCKYIWDQAKHES